MPWGSKCLFIVKTDSGWEWRNHAGASTVYNDQDKSYNRHGVKFRFERDSNGRIVTVKDHDGNQHRVESSAPGPIPAIATGNDFLFVLGDN